jgi:serralysin
MFGCEGDDIYIVDSPGDVVAEGIFGRHRHGDELGHVQRDAYRQHPVPHADGLAAIDGTGNAFANMLIGNPTDNALSGNGGNDTLDGEGGADSLAAAWATSPTWSTRLATSSASFVTHTLAAEVENLTLIGAACSKTSSTSTPRLVGMGLPRRAPYRPRRFGVLETTY